MQVASEGGGESVMERRLCLWSKQILLHLFQNSISDCRKLNMLIRSEIHCHSLLMRRTMLLLSLNTSSSQTCFHLYVLSMCCDSLFLSTPSYFSCSLCWPLHTTSPRHRYHPYCFSLSLSFLTRPWSIYFHRSLFSPLQLFDLDSLCFTKDAAKQKPREKERLKVLPNC